LFQPQKQEQWEADVPKVMREAEVDGYRRNGYHFPVDVLSADEVAGFRGKLEDYEAASGGPIQGEMRHRSHVLFSWIDEMIRHPRILDAVEDVLGPDILCWNTSFFIKEARDPGFVSWHQDATYWGLSSSDVATAWVAMSPANKVSGCMKFVAGTHLNQVAHEDTFDKNNLLTRGQEIAVEVDESQAVHVELKPGQASLHHVLLFHGSEPLGRAADRARDPLYPDASEAGGRFAGLGDAGARQGHAPQFRAGACAEARPRAGGSGVSPDGLGRAGARALSRHGQDRLPRLSL
jgi:non-haem Fe2+, alpha-ketoglutarate-dependent halogenase